MDAERLLHPSIDNNTVFDYLDDDRLFALPYEGYSTQNYTMHGADPTRLLTDGEVIDLGDRQLEVMHTPGRGLGGISLWESATKSLFTSDMLYDGNHGLAWPPSLPDMYVESLRRFLELPVSKVYPGHYGSFDRRRMTEIINQQISDLV